MTISTNSDYTIKVRIRTNLRRKKMRKDNNMIIQLQRYYALWKECTAMYEEWSKDQGLSSNGVFALHSFYESNGRCTQKMIKIGRAHV